MYTIYFCLLIFLLHPGFAPDFWIAGEDSPGHRLSACMSEEFRPLNPQAEFEVLGVGHCQRYKMCGRFDSPEWRKNGGRKEEGGGGNSFELIFVPGHKPKLCCLHRYTGSTNPLCSMSPVEASQDASRSFLGFLGLREVIWHQQEVGFYRSGTVQNANQGRKPTCILLPSLISNNALKTLQASELSAQRRSPYERELDKFRPLSPQSSQRQQDKYL